MKRNKLFADSRVGLGRAMPDGGRPLAFIVQLILLSALFLEPLTAPASPVPPSTKSSSRQFIVFGKIAADRSDICSRADALRARIRRVLQLRETWTIPVSVSLRYASGPHEPTRTSIRLEFNEAGPLVRIEVLYGKERSTLDRNLVEAILLDVAYAEAQGAERRSFRIPLWVVEGFLGLTELGESGHPAAAMFVALFQTNAMPPLADFFDERSRESIAGGSELYRGFATTLVRLLLEQPDGPQTMRRFLAGIASGADGSEAATLAYFPSLGGTRESAQRWWALAVARIAARYNHGPLSVIETESLLNAVLNRPIKIADKEVALFSGQEFSPPPRKTKVELSPIISELQKIALRANPLLLPILLEYIDVAALMDKGKWREVPAKLARLKVLREQTLRRSAEITSYLDWYEATQLQELSGAFKGFFELVREFNKAGSERKDPVSQYLDAIERELD